MVKFVALTPLLERAYSSAKLQCFIKTLLVTISVYEQISRAGDSSVEQIPYLSL